MINISYLVTCSSETTTLLSLLQRLVNFVVDGDEIVVVADSSCTNNDETKLILNSFAENPYVKVLLHKLDNDYSSHKNWGATQCKNKWIFQIDGDELPAEDLLSNIKDIIESNPDIEAFWIPRINDFRGVNETHARQWGWRLSISPTYNKPIVNWPDPQCRCFLNIPERIKWVGRLHERIQGNNTYAFLPVTEELALYHDKTIEKQVETNVRYNKLFTEKENRGFKIPMS
jgi:glycosyltransferase involved in cell wall biosynthesis